MADSHVDHQMLELDDRQPLSEPPDPDRAVATGPRHFTRQAQQLFLCCSKLKK